MFICAGGRPGVLQRNGIAGLAAGGCFCNGEIAAVVFQRQFPVVAVIIANLIQPVRLAAYDGRCEEDRCQI